MFNPNDKTAEIYDIVNSPLKNEEVTLAEIGLMKKLLPKNGVVLDVGCGTGRHAVKLVRDGYRVDCLDSSASMLDVLKKKSTKPEVIQADILKYKLKASKYDLMILMWNTFNEVALSQQDALLLLKKLKRALKQHGKILINIDDINQLDIENLDFQTYFQDDTRSYNQDWKVRNYDKKTNTTISREKITIRNMHGEVLKIFGADIKQRWWSFKEIEKLCEEVGLKITKEKIELNEELYLLLEAAS